MVESWIEEVDGMFRLIFKPDSEEEAEKIKEHLMKRRFSYSSGMFTKDYKYLLDAQNERESIMGCLRVKGIKTRKRKFYLGVLYKTPEPL